MIDCTEVPGLFRLALFRVVAVIDVFSRMPVAAGVTVGEPSAGDVVAIFNQADERYGPARHLVTDQGPQFTAEVFKQHCISKGIKQRFGAIGKSGSIAIIERMWRTLKALGGLRARRHWCSTIFARGSS